MKELLPCLRVMATLRPVGLGMVRSVPWGSGGVHAPGSRTQCKNAYTTARHKMYYECAHCLGSMSTQHQPVHSKMDCHANRRM